MHDAIADLRLLGVSRSGREFTIEVQVGKPHPADRCWACSIRIVGIDSRPRNIYGVDSFQALILGLRLVATELWSFVESGGELLYPTDRESFPLDAYFPKAERDVVLASYREVKQ